MTYTLRPWAQTPNINRRLVNNKTWYGLCKRLSTHILCPFILTQIHTTLRELLFSSRFIWLLFFQFFFFKIRSSIWYLCLSLNNIQFLFYFLCDKTPIEVIKLIHRFFGVGYQESNFLGDIYRLLGAWSMDQIEFGFRSSASVSIILSACIDTWLVCCPLSSWFKILVLVNMT